MTSQVLVPIDDSPPAHRALGFALAEYPTSAITILCVIPIPDADTYRMLTIDQPSKIDEIQQQRYQEAKQLIESIKDTATDHQGEISTRIIAGAPAETIISYATDIGTDYLVIGLNERSSVSQLLSNSVTETVIQNAPVPVIVIK